MPLLAILSLAAFTSVLAIRIVDPMVPAIARDLAATTDAVALLAAAFAFPYALSQPVLGPLGDAHGKARVIKLSLAVLAVMLAVSAVAASYELLFVARLVAGAVSGGIIPLTFAMVGDRFPMHERQVALSRVLMAMLTGQLFSAAGAGILASAYDWRTVMAAAALITLLTLLAAMRWLKPRADAVRSDFSLAGIRAGYRLVFANRRAPVCFVAVFLEGLAIFGFFPYLAAQLEARGDGGIREAGFVIAAMGLGGIAYTLNVRRLLAWLGLFPMMRLGGVLSGLGLAAVALAPAWQLQALAYLVVGLGFYMIHNSLQTQATELAPAARGASVSLHASSFFLGQVAGPVVYALALARFGMTACVLAAAGVLMLLGMWAAAMLERGGGAKRET